MYTISVPELYLSKSVNDHFQLSFAVTVLLVTSVPSANSLTVMLSGLFPSWLLLSFHVYVPETEVVSVLCVFIIL